MGQPNPTIHQGRTGGDRALYAGDADVRRRTMRLDEAVNPGAIDGSTG